MASIRITQFGGLLPKVDSRNRPATFASVAHNCILKDGSLRAQAEWVQVGGVSDASTDVRGMAYDIDSHTPALYSMRDPVSVNGAPFPQRLTVGVLGGVSESSSEVTVQAYSYYGDLVPPVPTQAIFFTTRNSIDVGTVLTIHATESSQLLSADGENVTVIPSSTTTPGLITVARTSETEGFLPQENYVPLFDTTVSFVTPIYDTLAPIAYGPKAWFTLTLAQTDNLNVGDVLFCDAPPASELSQLNGLQFEIAEVFQARIRVKVTADNTDLLPNGPYTQAELGGLSFSVGGEDTNSNIVYNVTGVLEPPKNLALGVPVWGHTVTVSPQFRSKKMTPRNYGITLVRKLFGVTQESPMYPLTQDGETTVNCFEGDVVGITVFPTKSYTSEYYLRIYRTFTGLDTGEAVGNALDTSWHLVLETPLVNQITVQYYDGNLTDLPFDVNYSQGFHPCRVNPSFFGLTEGGWFIAANSDGEVQASERYLPHAWPPENYYFFTDAPVTSAASSPNQTIHVTGMAISRDTVFFGTNNYPYLMAVSEGPAGMQGAILPYREYAPCNSGTISPTESGAVYAGPRGVYALGREGIKNISTALSNPDDVLYKVVVDAETRTVRTVSFGNTVFGAYHKGWYYGFCDRGQ